MIARGSRNRPPPRQLPLQIGMDELIETLPLVPRPVYEGVSAD